MYESNRLNELDKNYIANGGFDFFQRTLSRVRTGDFLDYDSADMFVRLNRLYEGVSSSSTVSRVEDAPSSIKAVNCSEVVYTAETSGAGVEIFQRIESIFTREMANEPISFGIWIKQDNLQSIKLEILAPTNRDDFGNTYDTPYIDSTIALDTSGTWVFVKIEDIQLDALAKKGLELRVTCTNPVTLSVLKSFRTTGLKLNIGKVARPWTQMSGSYQGDLKVCQRYFENQISGYTTCIGRLKNSGDQLKLNFLVEKRVIPAIENGQSYAYSTADNNFNIVGNLIGISKLGDCTYTLQTSSGLSTGNAAVFLISSWSADARL